MWNEDEDEETWWFGGLVITSYSSRADMGTATFAMIAVDDGRRVAGRKGL